MPGSPYFSYRDGRLHAEGVDLARIAAAVGTPTYVYSARALEDGYRRFAESLGGLDALVCYAVKANSNLAVIRTFADLGAGADVVSEGELARALAAGVPGERIVFAGVGKTEHEMAAGLDAGILQFNVESEPELVALNRVAESKGKRATVAIRINPDVDAKTHAKITTGKAENKFGIDIDRAPAIFELARTLPHVDAAAVAIHIGSQLTDLAPFAEAFARVRELVLALRAAGHDIRRIDFGGGLGIGYQDETSVPLGDYAGVVRKVAGNLGCQLVFEPGRYLVGNAGVLLSKVIYVKEGGAKRFVILDAAMNDLLRPALYDAHHGIVPVAQPAPDAKPIPVDVVGPVCETGDTFARDRLLAPVAAGDLVAFQSAGAYGAVMASTYNSRPLAPEVLVRDDEFSVIRPRPAISDLFADEVLPDWLGGDAADARPAAAATPLRRRA